MGLSSQYSDRGVCRWQALFAAVCQVREERDNKLGIIDMNLKSLLN